MPPFIYYHIDPFSILVVIEHNYNFYIGIFHYTCIA